MTAGRSEWLAQTLGEPAFCKLGYPTTQLRRLLGNKWEPFTSWFQGKTGVLCDGQLWNPMKQRSERSECVVPHGTVVYPWDVERFLRRKDDHGQHRAT